MNRTRHPVVVVGVDGSRESIVAARWAATEAERRHLTLRLVHAFTVPIVGVPADGIPPDLGEVIRATGNPALDGAVGQIRKSHPDIEISAELVNADPRRALVDASRDATLTVVGTRGGGRIPEVMLGSVALHIAAHGSSPVAVISPAMAEQPGGSILLGVDGSRNSEAAVAYAFNEAALRRAPLDAVLVWDDLAMRGFTRGERNLARLEDDEEHVVLAEALAGWRDKYPDVVVRQVVLRGRPADALLHFGGDQPEGAHPQLVVVGSRGRGGLTGLLLGSTSQSLICNANWPVVVVRRDSSS